MSISQIMGEALRTHPQIERSEVAVENAFQDILIARAARFPQISANYEWAHTNDPINTPTRGDIEPQSYGVSASLLVMDFGAVRHQVEAAKARHERSEHALVSQEYAIALSAADSYLDILQQRLALDYALAAYQDLRNLKKVLMKSGKGTEADINKVWQVKESLCSTTRTYFNEHQKATNFFISVVDLNPEDLYLDEPAPLTVDLDLEGSLKSAINHHPAFAMADAQIRDAQELVTAARSERYPKLSLAMSSHNYDHNSHEFGDRSREGGSISLRASVPLFTGGRISANVNKAVGNESIAQVDRIIYMRTVRRQVTDLIDAIVKQENNVRGQQIVVDTSRMVFENHLRVFNENLAAGVVDSQNVINLVEERVKYYKAQVDLNALTYALVMDRYNLVGQQGKLMDFVDDSAP